MGMFRPILSIPFRKIASLCKRPFWGLTLAGLLAVCAHGQTNVTMQHNDISRSGANTTETILTPSNVNVNSFGKLFSYPVDGYVYAQPLYVANVTMGAGTPQAGTTHNVLFIATQNDTVYAFDADSNGGANSSPLWQASMVATSHGAASGEKPVPNSDVSTGDIVPQIGITGTPVIDTTSNTIYLVSKSTLADTSFYLRLHALDITTGLEKFGGPVLLQASVSGTGNGSSGGKLQFDTQWENQRPGLLLLNGIVYIGFAAHGDNGPWHGWILAYNAKTLAQTGAYCTSPNGSGSGVWMSGSGLAADVPSGKPYGRMFIATGNGTYDAVTPYTNNMDYGDDHIRLDLTNGVMTVQDSFTPSNQSSLNSQDQDVAAGGILLLPPQGGAHPNELVQVGKQGVVYVVDRDTMGGYSTSTDNDVQEVSGHTGGLWAMPAYWNGRVYFWGVGSVLKFFNVTNGMLATTPTSSSTISSNFPAATPSISANGTTNGIAWAVQTDAYGSNGNAILRAFDATNVATELYDSTQGASLVPARNDAAGQAVKFTVPTITNGKVYVAGATSVTVYGLLSGTQQAAAPTLSPSGESFTGSISVSMSDTTAGTTIYYTTNGTTPTTASTKYTGPITVSTTETISAIASGTGLLTSNPTVQTYTLQTQTVTPLFTPGAGSYSGPQSVTISDATAGSTIYYTTDGSTPVPNQGTTKVYSGAITISATATLNAIATASGLSNSPVASGLYTITTPGGASINFSNGFSSSATSMTFNGSTDLDDTRLQLTSGLTYQAGSAWYNTPMNIQSFTTDFAMQLSNPAGDGMTFTIQNAGLSAVGPAGGGLGYGPDNTTNPSGSANTPIAKSIAIKFDLYSNAGESANSTGLYQNGASPTIPAIDLTPSGINLHSGDTMAVHITYNGTTLTMTITDAIANATFTNSWTVNVPSIVGGNTAYIGFTGGTGGSTSSQKIETWTFVSGAGSTQAAAAPTFSLNAGTYLGTQTVSLSDATPGATIYYTTNGTQAGTGSTQYTGPITVTSTETINAVAAATGYTTSAQSSALYTIESQLSPPTFTPAAGTYASAQSVQLSAQAGSTIYYTTNNTTPTTGSTVYSGPITVSANTTIQAIAVQSGFFTSNTAIAAYTIGSSGGTTAVSLGSGFTSAAMVLNGNASLNGTRLRLTDTSTSYEASSAWYNAPVNIQQFTTNFSFQITGGTTPTADGFAFVIQGGATNAVGPWGGGLGYGPDSSTNPSATPNTPIGKSIAVKFDLYSNATEGADSTGLYLNGASPTIPAVDMTSSGVNLHTTDVFNVQMTYDGTNLTMTVTDATTNATFTNTWPVNIPSTVGGNTAYVGFTGGTGGLNAIQEIIGWTMTSGSGTTQTPAATPTFSPGGGSYTTAQSVTINDSTSGATIYYTTDGTSPVPNQGTTKVYSGTISVAALETLSAVATASGFTTSAIGTAAYSINTSTGGGTSTPINYSGGFTSTGLAMNSAAALSGTRLRLTPTTQYVEGSAYFNTAVNIQSFTNDFTFQLTNTTANATGNGFTFVIQNAGLTALGPVGGGLGYGPDSPSGSTSGSIGKSVAIKFDVINNNGEGTNSTGLYVNGASPTTPATTITGGVVLNNQHTFKAHMTYDGTTLTLTITDTSNTANTFTTSWPINIPSTVGGNTAYVGFTAATGSSVANHDILTWTFSNSSTTSKTPIVYASTSLPAASSGPTFRTFSYALFPDTNGTILDATAVGQSVTFTVSIPTAGTYDIKLSYKQNNTRGISQFSINGTNVGAPLDQYLATEGYATVDYGTFNFATAGNYAFKFTITGKNASSSSYGVSFDDFTLTPQ